MNVKDLKEILKELPDDMEIVKQHDDEGNDYSAMYASGVCAAMRYNPNGYGYHDCFFVDVGLSEEEAKEEFMDFEDEWDEDYKEYLNAKKVLVLI